MRRRALLAIVLAALTVVAMPAVFAAAPDLNFSDDRVPNPYVQEDSLTIAEHDRAQMDDVLEYYDDDGDLAELPATVNRSQDAPIGVRYDKIDASAYSAFPRVDDETENSETWTDASNWSSSSGGSSSITISNMTPAGSIDAVNVDSSVVDGETATATFDQEVDITTDVDKRVLFFVGNVHDLSGDVEVRLVDGDGDYRFANISTSDSADDSHVIANETGNGIVFQERVGDLQEDTSGGDGTFDGIQEVNIVSTDDDTDVDVVGLDVERKSMLTIGEIYDEDAEETETIEETDGGTVDLTSIDSMGSWADSAIVHDLEVSDVRYRFEDLSDADDYRVEFSAADDYGSYPSKLEIHARLTVPTAIDLSHGSLTLEDEQGLVSERYATVRYAKDQGDTELTNVSDSDWIDETSTYGSQDSTHELDTSIEAGDSTIVNMVVLLQDDEVDDFQSSGAPGGPMDSTSGGGLWSSFVGFITSPVGTFLSLVGGIAAAAKARARWLGG